MNRTSFGKATGMIGALICAAPWLSGCGGDGSGAPSDGGLISGYEDPSGKSGTRLRRRYLESGPGAYMTTDFWDTELATSCSFDTAADSTLRCLPNFYDDVYFADPGCSEPVYSAPMTGEDCQDGWAKSRTTRHMYRKTDAPAVLSDSTIYAATESGCQAFFAVLDSTYWVAELVPSSEFVRGTRVDEARTDGMVARYVDGDDGSRALLETVHGTRGYTCSFDDEARCVPSLNASTRYTDAACTEPLAELYGTAVPPMLPVHQSATNGCATGTTYYETGAVVTPAQLYAKTNAGECLAVSVNASYRYYARGSEISLTSLPQATVVQEGTGAVQARRYVDGNGEPLGVAHAFWDTTRDEECDPAQTSANTYACLTASLGVIESSNFVDAACSDPTMIGTAYCAATAPRLLGRYDFGSCKEIPNVVYPLAAAYERGAAFGPDYYFENDYVTCEMRTFPASISAYLAGPDATSTLPPLVLDVE